MFLTASARQKVLRHKLPFQLRRIPLWWAQGGARRCAGALATSPEIPGDPALAATVLFKLSALNEAFISRSPSMLATALSSKRSVIKMRVNSRQNIVAANVSSRECLEEILGVTELCGMPVSTRIPADRGYSTGYLHGVERDLGDHELLQRIESSVPMVSVIRSGNAVTLWFAGPVPQKHHRPAILQPVLAVAISLNLKELALADIMASKFTKRPPGLPAEARLFDRPVWLSLRPKRIHFLCTQTKNTQQSGPYNHPEPHNSTG
ncbi:hypothetical protein MRX96_056674 [Rhipicephalus microplus]